MLFNPLSHEFLWRIEENIYGLFFKTLKHVFFIEVPNWKRNAIKG